MTFYNRFDTSIQCDEHNEVSPEEQAEVFQMMADEHKEPQAFEGYDEWLNSLENSEVEQIKDWQGNYSNSTSGASYNGIDV